jgi:hypothetical protein
MRERSILMVGMAWYVRRKHLAMGRNKIYFNIQNGLSQSFAAENSKEPHPYTDTNCPKRELDGFSNDFRRQLPPTTDETLYIPGY